MRPSHAYRELPVWWPRALHQEQMSVWRGLGTGRRCEGALLDWISQRKGDMIAFLGDNRISQARAEVQGWRGDQGGVVKGPSPHLFCLAALKCWL